MDGEQARVVTVALREIRDRVGDILKDSPTCGRPAGEILQALARIENAAFGDDVAPVPSTRGRAQGDRAHERNQPKRYIREHVGGSEVLAEYRNENPIPLRSPREILDAVVEVLSRAAKPMLFGDIQSKLADQFGDEPPDYQARIALRFLSSPDVGLVTRKRARYAAVSSRTIRRATSAAWENQNLN